MSDQSLAYCLGGPTAFVSFVCFVVPSDFCTVALVAREVAVKELSLREQMLLASLWGRA
ncbi:MAG: hypothetical protein Q8M02_14340 [Candidatus Didemnitutus sp.]|nr:hypothetical protein [Candidatus Didemnitutus sp.]